jgi:hypothetical protein
MTTPWNAAAWRARTYSTRKYKQCGPVAPEGITPIGIVATLRACMDDGVRREYIPNQPHNGERWSCCLKCGYIVCSCERQQLKFTGGGELLPMRPSGLNSVSCEPLADTMWNARAAKPDAVSFDSIRIVHEKLLRDWNSVPNAARVHPRDLDAIVCAYSLRNPVELCPDKPAWAMHTSAGRLELIPDASVPVGELRWKQ